ncbi:MAG: aconitate hydratase AcnA [Firmicutes bacterium]|nr:aconitate hydratase AcnA [Bacillota bacterium]
MNPIHDPFGARATLSVGDRSYTYWRLQTLEEQGIGKVSRLPYSIKILLEAVLRQCDDRVVTQEDVRRLARWLPDAERTSEVPFKPARVLLQDFTGVPAVADLAALRDAMQTLGGDVEKVNPLIPVDLVIDHSVQVDVFGNPDALERNMEREFERNRERYLFLKWAQSAFQNFRVVPPGSGIVHQVNLEYLAKPIRYAEQNGETIAYPDSLVGADSHTTMINGLGVLGWGVGGIEAEAGMLGQPVYFLTPDVIGVRLVGRLPEGATATDLALTVTQRLRQKGVVGKFVEFFGPGLNALPLFDRATIANMAPEYGATMGFFPIDEETLRYLRQTGRPEEEVALAEAYCKAQGLFHTPAAPEPTYTDVVELDLGTVEPTLAGPRRPQDRVPLTEMKQRFEEALNAPVAQNGFGLSPQAVKTEVTVQHPDGQRSVLRNGAVVIAAITSCTNTSNPTVMLGAGLLAKKAVERGLKVAPYVKTSLAPGSRVVSRYLKEAGLLDALEQIGFDIVGFGCTTCIGNSGPLPEEVAEAITSHDLTAAAVLSGNRNFEGRIHPLVKANYLASPPLVVAYALTGTVDIDLNAEPIGVDRDGRPVFLREIWPSSEEIQAVMEQAVRPEFFHEAYDAVFTQNQRWNELPAPQGALYQWDPDSTYIRRPPFFEGYTGKSQGIHDLLGAVPLALLGDSVTTDHISPAGSIAKNSPAAQYLMEHGVQPRDFNSYGSRRGNHEVMMRGTFANIRIRNQMVPGTEGGVTKHLPGGEILSIYDAAMRYQQEGIPVIVLAGKEYGTGSSRDWAAKGPALLGVRAVIAESFERIHRSNLADMAVLPLQFQPGDSWKSLGITGEERFDIIGLDQPLTPHQTLTVRVHRPDDSIFTFPVILRLDTLVEIEYVENGGILQTVLSHLHSA